MAVTWKKLAYSDHTHTHDSINSEAATDGHVLTADGAGGSVWEAPAGGGGGATKEIAQATHGFALGDVVRISGSAYVKAQADSEANAEVVGIVSAVADVNNFTLLNVGFVSGLSGLTADTVYFLSDSVAGAITSTEPTTAGHISKPVFVAFNTTSGYFFNWRGVEIGTYTGIIGDGVIKITVGTSAPGSPNSGDLWVDTT